VKGNPAELMANADDEAEIMKIFRELFDRDKIKMISQLTADELRMILSLLMLSKQMSMPILGECATTFLELRLSTERRSRRELLEAVKGYMHDRRYGMMDRIRGMMNR